MTQPTEPQSSTDNARRQRSWYWYDWANSAYVTTTSTVLIGPYLTAIAEQAACPDLPSGASCEQNLSVLGLPISPGSLVPYTVTVSTIISAILLLFVGAVADRITQPTRLMAGFAWVGSLAAMGLALVTGTNWQLGVVLIIVANFCLGGSLIVYDSLLVRIAEPDDRDRVSSRGWALGYLGGGLLLVINLVLLSAHDTFGLSRADAVRVSLFSAGLWWAVFTIIPWLGLRSLRVTGGHRVADDGALGGAGTAVTGSFGQLRSTFAQMRHYPQTLLFLVAYLFFNDGIQTVISSASIYGSGELGFSESQLVITILVVQFVAFGGALLFGRLALRHGAKRVILGGIILWAVVAIVAYFIPSGAFGPWLVLAVGIGVVLGGTQALSRSAYSQLVPRDREAEFFSLYQAMERGTSWLGTLVFGLVHQLTGSYRPSIVALVLFFIVGGVLLAKCDLREGIRQAGNPVPSKV
ncbi:MFS transporter [Dermacoccaceae bacterium W4C1]